MLGTARRISCVVFQILVKGRSSFGVSDAVLKRQFGRAAVLYWVNVLDPQMLCGQRGEVHEGTQSDISWC